MPIRLNLFAEDLELEDLRRRDPVKRLIFVGLVLVAAMLGWSIALLLETGSVKRDMGTTNGNLNTQTNSYAQILKKEKILADSKGKLRALELLATNRFLNGGLLDTLEIAVVENVQLTRLKLDQSYILNEEIKPADNEDTRPAKPATVTEKTLLTLTAMDTSPNGDAATRFQNALSATPYFRHSLRKTNGFRLTSVGAPQLDPSGAAFTAFTLEAHFPEKTR